jgi:hypothetical protein
MNLFFEFFNSKSVARQEEFDFCIKSNINSNLFNNIYAITNSKNIPSYLMDAQIKNKLQIIYTDSNRLQYQEVFELSNKLTKDNEINLICNTDIWFDETINLLKDKMSPEIAIGLSRWYTPDDYYMITGFHMDGKAAPESNDTWGWLGKCKVTNGTFPIGYYACDVRIMKCFEEAGYRVYNPAKSIKTWHKHVGRGQNPPTVPGPYWVGPKEHHTLEDLK